MPVGPDESVTTTIACKPSAAIIARSFSKRNAPRYEPPKPLIE
jgi:hypothetical protein